MICPKCEKQIPENSVFCSYCGEQIDKEKVSLVRLVKNGFAVFFFVLSLITLFLPLGTASSRTILARLDSNQAYLLDIPIRLSVFDCIESLAYLNDTDIAEDILIEIELTLAAEVENETLHKYYQDEELTANEIRQLEKAFNNLNPLIFLRVAEIRSISVSVILFNYILAIILIFFFISLLAFIAFAILDIFKPQYGGAVRKTIIINTVFGFFYFYTVVIFNQLLKQELAASAIVYFVVAIFCFLLLLLAKLIKSKELGALNYRLLWRNAVNLVGHVLIVACMVGSVFVFNYQGTDSATYADDEGVSTLFEITNYRNARLLELTGFNDSFKDIVLTITGLAPDATRSALKDFNSTVSFITATEIATNETVIFRLATITPFVIMAVIFLTILQLFISLVNTYYNSNYYRQVNGILTITKLLSLLYILVVAIMLVIEFNRLSAANSLPIYAYLGAPLIISSIIALLMPVFNIIFKKVWLKNSNNSVKQAKNL